MIDIDKKISPRLKMVASKVRNNSVAVDVGTDHAYIPVYLVKKGICEFIYAGDVVEGPLENAKKVVSSFNVDEKIELRLSDGLESFGDIKNENIDIIIAGMGGILISEILSKASFIKHENIRLILQPMTHTEDVRKFLIENLFEITHEDSVSEGDRNYIVIVANYTGKTKKYDDDFIYTGLLKNNQNIDAQKYIKKQHDRLKKKADALKKISNFDESEKIYRLIEKFYN